MALSTNPSTVRVREWRKKNRKQANFFERRRRQQVVIVEGVEVNKGKLSGVKLKYGLNAEQYIALYKQNDGKCHLCNKELDLLKKGVHVDHCHNSDKIRGLLCAYCNVMLGRIEKIGVNKIKKYLSYLRRTK